MTTLQSILAQSRDPAGFARAYAAHLGELLAHLDVDALATLVGELERARSGHHTLFVAGNGGSSSTASHMVNDFSFGARPASGATCLDVRCLSDNIPLLTAIANDHAYDHVFVRQLEMQYRPDDRLLVLSASGNSPNVVQAAAWVKARGGTVMGLVGFDGGELSRLCDIVLHVKTPKGEYGPVEDVHLVIDHIVTLWLHART
jgi:D-sedoheptulose 7-phosphate isomerase